MDYLALPLALREGYLGRSSLRESISYSIALILSTVPGHLDFDPEYGCIIWDKEFSDLHAANKADIRSSLRNAIDKYEKRIYNVYVSFTHSTSRTSARGLGMVGKVTGNYREGDEEKDFSESFKLG